MFNIIISRSIYVIVSIRTDKFIGVASDVCKRDVSYAEQFIYYKVCRVKSTKMDPERYHITLCTTYSKYLTR